MKRLLTTLICIALLSSCNFTRTETFIIKTLDQFETQKENVQLGIDLVNFNHYQGIKEAIPELTEEAIKDITCQYFIRNSDSQVSFRVILNNNALDYRKKIVDYFEKNVETQVEVQVKNKDIFDKAKKVTLAYLIDLDQNDIDSFWNNTGAEFKRISTKSNFIEHLEERKGIITKGGKRVFYSKLFNEKLEGTNDTEFFTIVYTFEKDNNMFEQITYCIENEELKIAGYNYRISN